MVDTKSLSKEELLSLADEHIFSLGKRDLGSALSYKNTLYGLGKMMYASESADAYVLFAPDSSITRNKARWLSGYGYGGVIWWENKNIAFPEIRPNGCGMLLMELEELPDMEKTVKRASEVNEEKIEVDGIEIDPDFGKGNHFFEFYEPLEVTEEFSDIIPSDSYFAILHSSGQELKNNVYSYVEKGEEIGTPLGKINVLRDGQIDEYYKEWEKLESFSKKRREILAEEVVGSLNTISNFTHQGLFSKTEARLGCYDTMDKSGKNRLFPVALRWDCPVYVFKGEKNLSEKVLERMEFKERAKRLGVTEKIKNINILPHGGGYDVQLAYQNVDMINTKFGNVYELSNPEPADRVSEIKIDSGITEFGKMTVTNPHELPYSYRGKEVVRKTMELELSEIAAKLKPITTLKM